MAKRQKKLRPTGVEEVDSLEGLHPITLQDYVAGVSAYILQSERLTPGEKKSAQIRVSWALASAIAIELGRRVPRLGNVRVRETKVAGGLRTVNADVAESHELDGLRLAIELKPVNLAVGRAIWNRFGDLRAFAVNIHLKFPFCVVGGVLTVPTKELVGTAAATEAEEIEDQIEDGEVAILEGDATRRTDSLPKFQSTEHLIRKVIERLKRSGGRQTEADAAHHLEAIAVIAYDPETAVIDPALPPLGSQLTWSEFLDQLATQYSLRFEQ